MIINLWGLLLNFLVYGIENALFVSPLSRAIYKYLAAMEEYGFQHSHCCFIDLGLISFVLYNHLYDCKKAPSSNGRTFSRCKAKIKNILAVHFPIPLIWVKFLIMSLSLKLFNSVKLISFLKQR